MLNMELLLEKGFQDVLKLFAWKNLHVCVLEAEAPLGVWHLIFHLILDVSGHLDGRGGLRKALFHVTLLKAESTLSLDQVSQSCVQLNLENL